MSGAASDDADFVESPEDVCVRVMGAAPSAGIGTEAVLFATNGTPSACHRYTVLGVRIEGYDIIPNIIEVQSFQWNDGF